AELQGPRGLMVERTFTRVRWPVRRTTRGRRAEPGCGRPVRACATFSSSNNSVYLMLDAAYDHRPLTPKVRTPGADSSRCPSGPLAPAVRDLLGPRPDSQPLRSKEAYRYRLVTGGYHELPAESPLKPRPRLLMR